MTTHWGRIFAIWFAGLCAAGQFAKVAVVFESLGARWPEAGAALGLVVSIVGVVGVIFGTSAGLAVARLGARRMLIAALAAGAALSALQMLGLPFGLMLVSRAAEGFAHLAIVVAGPVLMAASAAPKDQPAAMTLWSTFFGLAFTLMALVGLPFAEARGNEALWGLHGVLMLGAAALVWRVLPAERAEQGARFSPRAVLADHLEIYRSPRLAAPALGFVFYTAIYVAALTLVPGLLPPRLHALAAGAMPLISIAASLLIGVRLTARLGAVRTVQLGYAFGAFAVLLWLAGGAVVQLSAALLLSAALGLAQGASFAAIPELIDTAPGRAKAAGAIAQLGNVGTTLGTPLLLGLSQAFGAAALTLFALPLCLAGIAVHGWLAARRARL